MILEQTKKMIRNNVLNKLAAMDKKILWILFLMSSFTFAQTTVTLEDQCNCEVLKGDDVNSAGETTPPGADMGDIYVNTLTGTIYYWNGTTWQLTATDDQELRNFTFDTNTGLLSLEIESGNTVSVDLSALEDDQNALEVPYDNTNSGLPANNVQDALDAVNQFNRSVPGIYATGKINADGSPSVIFGAGVSRINEGDYQITFDQALTTDYVIQVSVLDCGGDCPGNTSDSYDSPGITYYDQLPTGFKVNIGDGDNGASPKDDIDIEFMFTIIVLPF